MKSTKPLTIVTSFLNEGAEPRKTIESIYATAPSSLFEIIAIDDCSDVVEDTFDDFPEVTYIRNEKRMGVQAAKQMGVEMAQTPYVLLIDAHMRFRDDQWCQTIIHALEEEPTTFFGVTCVVLRSYDEGFPTDRKIKKGYGAGIAFSEKLAEEDPLDIKFIRPTWIGDRKRKHYPDKEIPCLFGACYGVSREFFLKIRGLEGLKMWGSTEPYLSMKAWLAGGKCKLLDQIEVGHKFRDKPPYKTSGYFPYYNQVFLCKTLLPEEVADNLLAHLPYSKIMELAMMIIERNQQEILDLRNYYKSIFSFSFKSYCDRFHIALPEELMIDANHA